MTGLTVAGRFCGPPGTANGGYLAGRRLAAVVGTGTVAVRLHRSASAVVGPDGEVCARARAVWIAFSRD